jgi:glycosidase
MPRTVIAGPYYLRACIRRACRVRALTVTARGGPGGGNPLPGPGGGPGPGTGQPPGPAGQRSLRAALTDENFYFVLADRFWNGDPDNDEGGLTGDASQHGFDPAHKGYFHGGDLQGVLDQLDYIEGLGTTAIWLTPSFKNRPVQGTTAGYHGQWVTDFTQIDPHFGTNQDLTDLVDAAHARGIKVFLDIVTNHTADVIGYTQKSGGPAPNTYASKYAFPYRAAGSGTAFDDRDHAGAATFPALDAATSFPYTPANAPGITKAPAWLNDVTRYHNRGDTTFRGEDAQYGDFFGLDDLFTEHPDVVNGMVDIYKDWISDFGIDGFRLDTATNVNDEFWQEFAPEVLRHARDEGLSEFFMFGEVFDTSTAVTSRYSTRNRMQAVSDFPFQWAAKEFAAKPTATDELRDFFLGDDLYTDADSNAYQLQTFLGNHDMGRIGWFIDAANASAGDAEVYDRDVLAHELMYLSRGNPTVLYGDEQGFVGDGGDQDARQDMFASQVSSYNDDDLIGTGATTAQDNFETGHPLYAEISDLADLTAAHPALRNGAQQHRFSTDEAGIYAFSRFDRATGREYVVALNNSETQQTAVVPTATPSGVVFDRIHGDDPAPTATTNAARRLPVTLPPLSAAVYHARTPVPRSPAAPAIEVAPLPNGGAARDRVEVEAAVTGTSFYDVTFQAKVGGGAWQPIGTDDNAPYRVFHDVANVAPGTTVQYRAIVLDNASHARLSNTSAVQVAPPEIVLTAPDDGANARDTVELSARATPDRNHYSVEFQRSVGGGAWEPVDTDSSQGAYTGEDDTTAVPDGTPIQYRAVLTYATGSTVTSASRTVTPQPPVETAVIHYNRPAGDYPGWGIHFWGDATADADEPSWPTPQPPDSTDAGWAHFEIDVEDDLERLWFIVYKTESELEPGGDRSFVPYDHPEIWLKQGDSTVYFAEPPV